MSVDRLYDESFSLQEGENLLSIIATMLAQHVINLENLTMEQEQLRQENLRLRGELGKKFRVKNIIGNRTRWPSCSRWSPRSPKATPRC